YLTYGCAIERPKFAILLFASACSRCLKQKPRTALCLVDPDFQKTRRRNVAMLIAKVMRLAHARGELFIVVAQFGKHIHRADEIRLVVLYALQAANLADRSHCRSTQLANT